MSLCETNNISVRTGVRRNNKLVLVTRQHLKVFDCISVLSSISSTSRFSKIIL